VTSPSDEAAPIYHISAVASLTAVHPQTLRMYERQGLLKPSRSRGNTRLYAWRDVERVRLIVYLSKEEGINLAGVARILELQQAIQQVESTVQDWMRHWHEHRVQPQPFVQASRPRSADGATKAVKIPIQRADRSR